jgi:hypothetical protein
MLDGRIDTQGTVADLRSLGILEDIKYDEATEVKEQIYSSELPVEAESPTVAVTGGEKEKKPRKLVADEHRETGGVKWSVYNTYLKASYVGL